MRVLLPLSVAIAVAITGPARGSDQPLRGGFDELAVHSNEYAAFSGYVLRSAASADPSPVGTADLRGAIESALGSNPGLRAAMHDARAARAGVWKELAAFTPVISAKLNRRFEAGGFDSVSTDVSNNAISLELALPVWTSGQRYYSVQGARARQRAAIYSVMSARDDLTLRVADAWMRVVSGVREIKALRTTARNLAGLENAVSRRVKAGFASSDDLALVRADHQALKRAVAGAEARLAKARADLSRQSNINAGEGASLPQLDRFVGESMQTVLERARRKNPQLRAAAETYQASRADSRASFASNLPRVELVGQYRYATDHGVTNGARNGWNIGAQLTVPLVDLAGWADTTAEQERASAALYREAETLRTVDYQVETLWSDFIAARTSLSPAKVENNDRRHAATATRARYNKGLGDLETAVLREREAVTAELGLLNAQVTIQLVAAQLLLLSGDFDISQLSWQE